MKDTCISCDHFQDGKCFLKKYNNLGNCKSHKKRLTLDELIKERNKLLVTRSDITRLEFLTKKIDYLNYGIC